LYLRRLHHDGGRFLARAGIDFFRTVSGVDARYAALTVRRVPNPHARHQNRTRNNQRDRL
jgi:hypothetical protein